MDNHIKSSNFAESFLVVEELALISIHFGKLLTVTRFLMRGTSNLCDKPVLMTFASLFVVFSLLSLDQVSDFVRIPYKFIF